MIPTQNHAPINVPESLTPLKTDIESFRKTYDYLSAELLDDLKVYRVPKEAIERIRTLLEHTVCGGKMNRGQAVVDTLIIIAQANGKTSAPKDIFGAHILGWCVEWLQACFLVADDVMDQSHTRRGKPCWYKMEGVGLSSINDSFILKSHIYKMIRKYFKHEYYYADLLDLINEVSYQTELGQLVDMITAPEDNVDLRRFSLERHQWIVEYKTAYYSFYLPVAMSFLLSGISDHSAYEQAKSILIPLGEYFQVQDDFLDCYGDPQVIGKIGTDIEDNKCSWLVNQALARANPEQIKILDANYGKKIDSCIANVKNIFKELGLEKVFEEYEDASYKRINAMIQNIQKDVGVPEEVYNSFMKKIYKRNK